MTQIEQIIADYLTSLQALQSYDLTRLTVLRYFVSYSLLTTSAGF
jgi:hypothetical protein